MTERRERNRPFSFSDLDPEDWTAVKQYDWAEPKYDGHFARVELVDREWTIYSSTDRIVNRGELRRKHKPTTFWAEHIRGTEWSRRPARAELYEHLAVFGSPRISGKLMIPHADITRDVLTQWLAEYKLDPFVQRLFLVERVPAARAKQLWDRLVTKGDYEGVVLGGPLGLARMKATATCDYVCMGFESSDSDRFAGWGVRNVVGGLYVNGLLRRITTVSGLTDEQRRDFHDNPSKYEGRVFEAEGKRLFSTGKLRHPNFLRWRDDKPAAECTPPRK